MHGRGADRTRAFREVGWTYASLGDAGEVGHGAIVAPEHP